MGEGGGGQEKRDGREGTKQSGAPVYKLWVTQLSRLFLDMMKPVYQQVMYLEVIYHKLV